MKLHFRFLICDPPITPPEILLILQFLFSLFFFLHINLSCKYVMHVNFLHHSFILFEDDRRFGDGDALNASSNLERYTVYGNLVKWPPNL